MFADLTSHDVFFNYQALGFGQLVGTAADIVSILMLVLAVAVSIACLNPDAGV
jgi:hypothetical protein